jgi:hypothetical protein
MWQGHDFDVRGWSHQLRVRLFVCGHIGREADIWQTIRAEEGDRQG